VGERIDGPGVERGMVFHKEHYLSG
jgi:hypothetical protein